MENGVDANNALAGRYNPLTEARRRITNATVANHHNGIFDIGGISFYAREWYYPHTWNYQLNRDSLGNPVDDVGVYVVPYRLESFAHIVANSPNRLESLDDVVAKDLSSILW